MPMKFFFFTSLSPSLIWTHLKQWSRAVASSQCQSRHLLNTVVVLLGNTDFYIPWGKPSNTNSMQKSWVQHTVTVLWREEGYTMKYTLSPRDFQRAQGIFHCLPWLKSQYSHSQLSLLANIFLHWLRELAIFSRIG